jgi:hypothetical protein
MLQRQALRLLYSDVVRRPFLGHHLRRYCCTRPGRDPREPVFAEALYRRVQPVGLSFVEVVLYPPAKVAERNAILPACDTSRSSASTLPR